MRKILPTLFIVLSLIAGSIVQAESSLLVVRSKQEFPEAMLALQGAIVKQGYTVARVQRVDIGLTGSGYKTDKYRIVFFGKPDEVRKLSNKYPDIIPFLPLSFSIFAENEQTLIVCLNPKFLSVRYQEPELIDTFRQWSEDVHAILAELRAISVNE
jgi:uncharacterized protein (DUF302 family)